MGGLTEPDSHGLKAYLCTRDGASLEPLADTPGVLRCPTCGHRTDASGDGVLGDGFDIIHRQWGLRGDPHAWSAMRELVAATPTPTEHDAIRAAYLDALRRVANVELDSTEDAAVSREHLDHGGMSGGRLDLAWWRTKGIPLLVDRAADRRPESRASEGAATNSAASRPRRGVKGLIGDILAFVALLAIPAATIDRARRHGVQPLPGTADPAHRARPPVPGDLRLRCSSQAAQQADGSDARLTARARVQR